MSSLISCYTLFEFVLAYVALGMLAEKAGEVRGGAYPWTNSIGDYGYLEIGHSAEDCQNYVRVEYKLWEKKQLD